MKKVALFVEGQAESIFVREFLLKWYEYNVAELGFDCYTMFSSDIRPIGRSYGNKESAHYYQIINVNNDNSVLGRIMENADRLVDRGFELIIGLRDMYTPRYREMAHDHRVHVDLNQRFIKSSNKIISECLSHKNISFHFAIMEVEAWMIGLLNLSEEDPETAYIHPAKTLCDFMRQAGKQYDKKEGEVESICSQFTKEHFHNLLDSGRCSSFASFVQALVCK